MLPLMAGWCAMCDQPISLNELQLLAEQEGLLVNHAVSHRLVNDHRPENWVGHMWVTR